MKAGDIYSDFDPETMELFRTDLPPEKIFIHYDNLLGHFNVGKDGLISEKSIEEKAEARSIRFDPEILKEYIYQEETLESATEAMRIVELAMRLKLFKRVDECKAAFKILDIEQESRLAEKYSPGYETKLLKDYTAWIGDGKPEDDKREEKYLKMTAYIAGLKEEYKALRGELKKLITQIKAIEAEKPTESNTKAEIQRYMDAKGLFYKPDDPKKYLLEVINEQGNTAAAEGAS